MKYSHGTLHGIPLKKQFGQHFLKDHSVIEHMLDHVHLTNASSVFEIGCGDGILTSAILAQPVKQLWVFEIDPHWAQYVQETYPDSRLKMHLENILDVDFSIFKQDAPWTLLANLPYQVTFPILHMLCNNKQYLQEGVIMVQEEVAQKVTKTSGRGYGYQSLYMQHHFEWKMLKKVLPGAFFPPPKVDSRLLYFKPRAELDVIEDEKGFWAFIKRCFLQPRRTLKNNLQMYHYALDKASEETLALRAQQMSKKDLMELWSIIKIK